MSHFSQLNDIGSLSTLLSESRIAQENNNYNQPPSAAVTPSTVVLGSQKTVIGLQKPIAGQLSTSSSKTGTRDIWLPEEILTEDALVEWKDERPVPRYEFSYKQSVGTEDTFLGMSDKTPLTSDCTHLVIKVHFPRATMKDLDLNVTKNRIKAASKTHHLFTYLPVNVDSDNGKAKFDTAKEVLTVTLPIVADY
jgi:hypothetical protein